MKSTSIVFLTIFIFFKLNKNAAAQLKHHGTLHSKSQLEFSRQKTTANTQPRKTAYDPLIIQANISMLRGKKSAVLKIKMQDIKH